MEYKNIIFDFDGTLVDTAAVILETMSRTISALRLPSRSADECRKMIGYRLEDIPSILWPECSNISEKYAKTYREMFNTVQSDFKVQLYPQVAETLSILCSNGVNMAIASSRSKPSLQEITDELGIAQCFQQLIGGGDVTNGKPSPEPVNRILSMQNWLNTETLVVGDMNVDIMMGKNAGTATCAVTYGNGTLTDLLSAHPDYIIPTFAELLEIV